MAKMTNQEDSPKICPQCNIGHLVVKTGRYGNFTACSNFPNCKYIVKEEKEKPEDTGISCDQCGEGMLVIRTGRFGRFMACSNYPKCRNTKKIGSDGKPVEPKANFSK